MLKIQRFLVCRVFIDFLNEKGDKLFDVVPDVDEEGQHHGQGRLVDSNGEPIVVLA